MALLVGAALAVFSVAILAYPFLKSRMGSGTSSLEPTGSAAISELEPIYDAIRTLQLEYQLGRVPDYLYREQLQGYRIQAAVLLRQQATERSSGPDWLLEQEVLLARAALRQTGGGPRPCPNCRSFASPELVLCPECGAALGR